MGRVGGRKKRGGNAMIMIIFLLFLIKKKYVKFVMVQIFKFWQLENVVFKS